MVRVAPFFDSRCSVTKCSNKLFSTLGLFEVARPMTGMSPRGWYLEILWGHAPPHMWKFETTRPIGEWWDVCDEASEAFTILSHCPTEVSDDDLQKLEKFVVLMYDKSSAETGVDDARLDLFARKQRSWCNPTNQCSSQRACKTCCLPGWDHLGTGNHPQSRNQQSSRLRVVSRWRVMADMLDSTSPIATSCQELTKCACKKGCNCRCKCFVRTLLYCTLQLHVWAVNCSDAESYWTLVEQTVQSTLTIWKAGG